MENFEKILIKIINHLNDIQYKNGDISDIGNEIGYISAQFFDEKKIGYSKQDFIAGIKHGISLIDNTHDKK